MWDVWGYTTTDSDQLWLLVLPGKPYIQAAESFRGNQTSHMHPAVGYMSNTLLGVMPLLQAHVPQNTLLLWRSKSHQE